MSILKKKKEISNKDKLQIANSIFAESFYDFSHYSYPSHILEKIVNRITKILSADRTTIFLYDKANNEFYSYIIKEKKEVRFNANLGIAGEIKEKKEIINIRNVYAYPRFNPNIDIETGFKTRNILGAPLITFTGELIGIMEIINKKKGEFDNTDIEIVKALSSFAAFIIKNEELHNNELKNRELAILGRIATGISHDMKNMLSVISGYTQLIEEQDSSLSKYTGKIIKEIEYMTSMLSNVLIFSKGATSKEVKKIKFQEIVSDITDYFNHELQEKNIEFIVEHDKNGEFNTDYNSLRRALINIITNSIDALVDSNTRKKQICISIKKIFNKHIDRFIRISIRDNGPGIDSKDCKKIFKPFFSKKNKGTGLGLFIAKENIELLNGYIELEYGVSKGAGFIIYLPLESAI